MGPSVEMFASVLNGWHEVLEHVFRLQFGHADLKPIVVLDISRVTGVGLEANAGRKEVDTLHTFLSWNAHCLATFSMLALTFIQRELSSLRASDVNITVQKLVVSSNNQEWMASRDFKMKTFSRSKSDRWLEDTLGRSACCFPVGESIVSS